MNLGHPQAGEARAPQRRAVAESPVAVLYEPVRPDGAGAHMTLVVGIAAEGGIVLVGDGLVTAYQQGSLTVIEDGKNKLFGFGRYALGASGFTGLSDDLVHELKKRQSELDVCRDVIDAKRVVESTIHALIREQSYLPDEWIPTATVLFAGYDADQVTPRLYCIGGRSGFRGGRMPWAGNERGGIAADAVARLLLGGWSRPGLSFAEAKLFGVMAVRAAKSVDPHVGSPTGVAMIAPGEGYRDLSHELPQLEARADRAEAGLRGILGANF